MAMRHNVCWDIVSTSMLPSTTTPPPPALVVEGMDWEEIMERALKNDNFVDDMLFFQAVGTNEGVCMLG